MCENRYKMRIRPLLVEMLALLLVCMAACGGKKASEQDGQNSESSEQPGKVTTSAATQEDYSWLPPGREWVYLPETILVEEASANYNTGRLIGDTYHYYYFEEAPEEIYKIYGNQAYRIQESRYCRYDLSTKEFEKIQLNWDAGEDLWSLEGIIPCENSNLWTLQCKTVPLENGRSEILQYVALFDQNGECLYSEDRTEWKEYLDQNKISMNLGLDVDSKGRLYEFDINRIVLWEADGTPAGSIRHDDWETTYIPAPLKTEDGGLIVLLRWGGNGYNMFTNGALLKVDFDGKVITTLAEGLAEIAGIGKAPETLAGRTGYYDLVLYNEEAVYGYSLADRKKEELFTWKECNLTGKGIKGVGTTEDGRLYALVDDWNSDDHRIVLFTEVRREEAPPLEVLALATVGEIRDDLNAAAMRFNRINFPCRVEVKSYEAVTDLYNALLAGDPIDILDLSRVNLSVLTGRGLLEDLSPYLEQNDSEYKRSDFVEGILDAYTVDGVLTGIPDTFSIRTVAGNPARYDSNIATDNSDRESGGLTLEGFLSATEQHPGAKPLEGFEGLTREELMQYLMIFNMEEFVDWETGECRFDSAEFKRLLELLKRFPEPVENAYEEISLPTKLQKGEVLYVVADINNFQSIDLYQQIFERDEVCVGFPTPDGSGGHLLLTNDAFGIIASSQHKESSWKFLESVINHRVKFNKADTVNLRISYNWVWKVYPTLQKTLDTLIESQLELYRQSEESGSGHGATQLYGEDWTYQQKILSREDVETGPRLVKYATPCFDAEGDYIIRIISEEAPAYFSGQKSLDAVTDVIQNRAKLYINENR